MRIRYYMPQSAPHDVATPGSADLNLDQVAGTHSYPIGTPRQAHTEVALCLSHHCRSWHPWHGSSHTHTALALDTTVPHCR